MKSPIFFYDNKHVSFTVNDDFLRPYLLSVEYISRTLFFPYLFVNHLCIHACHLCNQPYFNGWSITNLEFTKDNHCMYLFVTLGSHNIPDVASIDKEIDAVMKFYKCSSLEELLSSPATEADFKLYQKYTTDRESVRQLIEMYQA